MTAQAVCRCSFFDHWIAVICSWMMIWRCPPFFWHSGAPAQSSSSVSWCTAVLGHCKALVGFFSRCQLQVVRRIFPQFNAFLSTWKTTVGWRPYVRLLNQGDLTKIGHNNNKKWPTNFGVCTLWHSNFLKCSVHPTATYLEFFPWVEATSISVMGSITVGVDYCNGICTYLGAKWDFFCFSHFYISRDILPLKRCFFFLPT